MDVISRSRAITVGLAAAFVAGSLLTPASMGTATAVPLSANAPALKEAAPDSVVDVHWRGYGWGYYGGAVAAGVALGVIGSAIAAPYYYGYPYQPYYYRPYYRPYRAYYRPYYRPYYRYHRAYYRPYRYW